MGSTRNFNGIYPPVVLWGNTNFHWDLAHLVGALMIAVVVVVVRYMLNIK